MYKQGEPGFKYYVGVRSLDEVATRRDQVCVLNILGSESRSVTPTSHAYSGGNIVFGTSPGRGGEVLETPIGDVPVFDNVRQGLDAGYHFDTGVIYLPPAGVRHGFYELVRVNPDLRKVVIITEKVPVHDARAIRAVAQQVGVDVFGANCLGVADSWNHVRIGGALGGDAPEESLQKGSIAIYSNSGNFTTTIANYLASSGWGTTTLISSGKDAYIHFAPPEFVHALAHDPRSKAAVMYIEPGGYYEQGLDIKKPVVACVVGQWKAKLTRPVGHAGAIAGSGDDADAKIEWFRQAIGVPGIYTPEDPIVSPRGAIVANIAHIPAALTAVMRHHCLEPDFAPRGSLALQPWFENDQGLDLPPDLRLPAVKAVEPYGEHIRALDDQIGATFARESMKDASGASRMDPETGVTSLHGVPVLELGKMSFESLLAFSLLREAPSAAGEALANTLVLSFANLHGTPGLAAADAARRAGASENTVLAAAVSTMGPRTAEGAQAAVAALLEIFHPRRFPDAYAQVELPAPDDVDPALIARLSADEPDLSAQAVLSVPRVKDSGSVFVRFVAGLPSPSRDAAQAALALTLAWRPLARKRISRHTAHRLPWYFRLFGTMLGASIDAERHTPDGLLGLSERELLGEATATDLGFRNLVGLDPSDSDRAVYQVLLGLLVSNGPGTISAQGAKGAVSADGPESPERVQLDKAMLGFLTHTGFSHGGNGYEGIEFLRERFEGSALEDPGAPEHGLDLDAIARRFALEYRERKAAAKAVGDRARAIPGINHPVYKGRPVNEEPREVFVHELFASRGEYNVFHEFYRRLVRVLAEEGVTPNVFAVNVDAVLSALLLKLMYRRHRSGEVSKAQLERAAFVVFLYGRMVGCAAEIDDHTNRGRNMDTRTPQSKCRAVT